RSAAARQRPAAEARAASAAATVRSTFLPRAATSTPSTAAVSAAVPDRAPSAGRPALQNYRYALQRAINLQSSHRHKGGPMKSMLAALAVSLVAVAAHAATDPLSRCAVAEMKATAKKTTSKLKCYATAAEHKTAVDQGCLTKAESKFGEAWARATAKGGCGGNIVGPLDQNTVEGRVDACVRDLVTTVAPCGRGDGRGGGVCPPIRVCFGIR